MHFQRILHSLPSLLHIYSYHWWITNSHKVSITQKNRGWLKVLRTNLRNLYSGWYTEWFSNSVQKLNRTYGMLHSTIWGWDPEVHESSLRRYGSKHVYHITVYFLFTLVTVTCKNSIGLLTQLTYHFASYNSCSNWLPPTSMQAWHRRTSFCRTLTNIPGVFWITGFTDPIGGCSTEQFEVGNLESVKAVTQNTPGIFIRMRQKLVRRCHACIEVGGRQIEQLL